MSQQSQARKEIEAALIAKAQAEPAFRQALLKDAKAAIEKELGVKLPAGSELKVVEETATTNYLVLPLAEGVLSEADLGAVAGGMQITSNNLSRSGGAKPTPAGKAAAFEKK
jgi:hypothetical protein